MMKITDTMVLAALKKGLVVEGENMEMNMNMEMDLDFLGEGSKPMKVNMECKIGSYKLKLKDDSSEF